MPVEGLAGDGSATGTGSDLLNDPEVMAQINALAFRLFGFDILLDQDELFGEEEE